MLVEFAGREQIDKQNLVVIFEIGSPH
jgi:hypothetical protein